MTSSPGDANRRRSLSAAAKSSSAAGGAGGGAGGVGLGVADERRVDAEPSLEFFATKGVAAPNESARAARSRCGVAGCVGASCVGTSSVSGVLTRWVGWRIVAGASGWDSC